MLTKVENWVIDIRHSRGHFNYYMQVVDLYWHSQTLLGMVLINRNEAQGDILLQLEEIEVLSHSTDCRLSKVEVHLGLSPTPSCSLKGNKDPIPHLLQAANQKETRTPSHLKPVAPASPKCSLG